MRTGRRPPPSAGRQAKPSVFDVEGNDSIAGSDVMDEIRLPQHVVNRIERRWASRFAQTLGGWLHPERAPSPSIRGSYDPLQSPQVRRLLEGSLRPPVPSSWPPTARAHCPRTQELFSESRVF